MAGLDSCGLDSSYLLPISVLELPTSELRGRATRYLLAYSCLLDIAGNPQRRRSLEVRTHFFSLSLSLSHSISNSRVVLVRR